MALLLLPARGDRDDHLPLRGDEAAALGRPRPAVRFAEARRVAAGPRPLGALRAEDGHGLGQDQGDVAADRVGLLQRGPRERAAGRLHQDVRDHRAQRDRLPAAARGFPRRQDLPRGPALPAGMAAPLADVGGDAGRSVGIDDSGHDLSDQRAPALRPIEAPARCAGAGGDDGGAGRPAPERNRGGVGQLADADARAPRPDGAERRGPPSAYGRAGVGQGDRAAARSVGRAPAGAVRLHRDPETPERPAVRRDRGRLPDRAGD